MITSMANGRVKQIVLWQNKAGERRKDQVFIAEGIKMYAEAPAGWILETYVSEKCLGRLGEKDGFLERECLEKLAGIGFEAVSEDVLAKMSGTQSPQGILCVLKRPSYELDDMLKRERENSPLLLVLENLQDPGNLGAMVRTGEGAGISGLIMSRDTADIYNPKVIRATMGSIYRLPHMYAENLQETVKNLKERKIRVYAAHLQGDTFYDVHDYRESTAFLIGNEGNGLQAETAKLADGYVKIPMEGQVESLNAAVSAAVLLYEAHRQRAGEWKSR